MSQWSWWSYNTAHLLEPMFAALDASRGTLKLQVIVIDNASRDGSVNILRKKYPTAQLIKNQSNIGFARGAAKHALTVLRLLVMTRLASRATR